jgi:hypothetical protein
MTMRSFALLAFLAVGACSHDIRLGGDPVDAMPDAMPDAASLTFDPGTYTVSFLDPPLVDCQGTLSGKESDFAGITRATSGLVDGAVLFSVTVNQLTISGAPIQSGFPQSTIALVPQPGAQPPVWTGSVDGQFGSGPDATTRSSLVLAADTSTAHASSGIQGAYGQLFVTAGQSGACTVSLGALFVSS